MNNFGDTLWEIWLQVAQLVQHLYVLFILWILDERGNIKIIIFLLYSITLAHIFT